MIFRSAAARTSVSRHFSSVSRRQASSTPSETASKVSSAASKTASESVQKAQDAASKAFETAKKYAGPVGDRIGSLLGSYRQPLVYNSQVFVQLLKQVYKAERLSPPSLAEVQSAYQTLFKRAIDKTYWQDLISTGQWKKVAVGGLEVYGIFKVGEIIGRRNLVGYKLD
ncbi:hypothetical protein FRC03_005271 [Tulasnella sp. 419]|nr:hypothetical protein FRC02_008171 [Tulasnella sp. 418]KAG8961550.1 hypothetical protein FRC03_005271 [Tulasnella sp. 419]